MNSWHDSKISRGPQLRRPHGPILPFLPRQLRHGIIRILLLLLLLLLSISRPNPQPQPSTPARNITTEQPFWPMGLWSACIRAVPAHYARPLTSTMNQRSNAVDLITATTDIFQDNYDDDDAEFQRTATADDSGKCLITSCCM